MKKACIASLILLTAIQASCGYTAFWPSDRFDSARWRSTKQDQRYRMVNDLMNRHLLIGLDRTQVEALLGPAGSWGLGRNYCTYVVKVGGGGFNQVFIVDVGFDEHIGRVATVRVRGD
jgi:hypothetical protein